MATDYLAGVDLSKIGTWSLTIDDNGGGSPTVYDEDDLSSTLAMHIATSNVSPAYSSLSSMISTAIAAEPVSLLFSTTTYDYQFTYTGGGSGFDMTLSQAAADSLGITTLVHTNVTGITSDRTPYYVILSQTAARSAYSRDYEPEGVASQAVSDDATNIFGLARTTSPKFLDWRQQFETLESTFKAAAATAVPWTWEHLFEHCRTVFPVKVIDSDNYDDLEVFLRPEGAQFRPEPQTPDYDSQWHIPLNTVLAGRT